MKKIFLIPFLLLIPIFTLSAQTDKLSWRVAGRFHIDGVGYVNSPDTLSHQLDIVDIRLGAKVTMGDWYVNLDVAYTNNKVALKDAFVQYAKHHNYFRLGHQYVFTGIDQPNSSNDMLLNAASNVGGMLDNGRRIGLTYTRAVPHFYLTTGLFVGDDIHVRSTVKQGYSTLLRTLWRPINEEFSLFHIGASAYYKVPNEIKGSNNKIITLSSRGAVRSKSPDLHFLTIDHVKNQVQCVGEIYGHYHRWMAVSEFHWSKISREDAVSYTAHGGYIEGGFLTDQHGRPRQDLRDMIKTYDGMKMKSALWRALFSSVTGHHFPG